MKVGDIVVVVKDTPAGVRKDYIGKIGTIIERRTVGWDFNVKFEYADPIDGLFVRPYYEHELSLAKEYNVKKLLDKVDEG